MPSTNGRAAARATAPRACARSPRQRPRGGAFRVPQREARRGGQQRPGAERARRPPAQDSAASRRGTARDPAGGEDGERAGAERARRRLSTNVLGRRDAAEHAAHRRSACRPPTPAPRRADSRKTQPDRQRSEGWRVAHRVRRAPHERRGPPAQRRRRDRPRARGGPASARRLSSAPGPRQRRAVGQLVLVPCRRRWGALRLKCRG